MSNKRLEKISLEELYFFALNLVSILLRQGQSLMTHITSKYLYGALYFFCDRNRYNTSPSPYIHNSLNRWFFSKKPKTIFYELFCFQARNQSTLISDKASSHKYHIPINIFFRNNTHNIMIHRSKNYLTNNFTSHGHEGRVYQSIQGFNSRNS